jgi:hypothetical protein
MLLCEIYPKENKLKHALFLMAIGKNKKTKYKVSARMYENIKTSRNKISKPHSEETKIKMRKPKPEGFGINISNKLKGTKRSDKTKLKQSLSGKGKHFHNKGKKASEDTKLKMSNSGKGKIRTDKTKLKISKSLVGKHKTQEHKTNIKLGLTGKTTKKHRSVNQYDLEGNFIKTWNKIKEASSSLERSWDKVSITQCCKGKQKTAFGFKWKYKDED